MLNGEAGRNLRPESARRFESRDVDRRTADLPRVARAVPHVLIVDAEVESSRALVDACGALEVHVEGVRSVPRALARLDESAVDLVIADERVGESCGLTFLAELRATHPACRRGLVTGLSGIAALANAVVRAELSLVLHKPWTKGELLTKVQAVVGARSRYRDWTRAAGFVGDESRADRESRSAGSEAGLSREAERVVRGLLVGLHACESAREVGALIQSELEEAFGSDAVRSRGGTLGQVFRALQPGLQLTLQRIRAAERRARAASRLAETVSEELRTPIGALAHAVDRLRGEAEREGLSSESVERVCSESARMARAVAQVEGEIRTEQAAAQRVWR